MGTESDSFQDPEGAASDEDMRRIRRRLLLEAAIEEGYPVRLQQHAGAGRVSTRMVRPVELERPDSGVAGAAMLVTRAPDDREIRFSLDEVDSVSIVTTQFRAGTARRGPWSVGDAVIDPQRGVGIVQAFRDDDSADTVVVRFESGGPRSLPLEGGGLRPLE